MTSPLQIHWKLMRRRARLFSRQIAIASILTAAAVGFLASARILGTGERPGGPVQQSATIAH